MKIQSCIYEISNLKDWYISNKVAIKLYRQVDLVRKYGWGTLLSPRLVPLMKEDALLRLRGWALASWLSPDIVFKNIINWIIMSNVTWKSFIFTKGIRRIASRSSTLWQNVVQAARIGRCQGRAVAKIVVAMGSGPGGAAIGGIVHVTVIVCWGRGCVVRVSGVVEHWLFC